MEMISGNEGIEHSEREDFSIDYDDNIIIYDECLLNAGFKYLHTLMSAWGGIREYTKNNIIVSINRHDNKIFWFIDRLSDRKSIYNGIGFNSMKLKVMKFIGD